MLSTRKVQSNNKTRPSTMRQALPLLLLVQRFGGSRRRHRHPRSSSCRCRCRCRCGPRGACGSKGRPARLSGRRDASSASSASCHTPRAPRRSPIAATTATEAGGASRLGGGLSICFFTRCCTPESCERTALHRCLDIGSRTCGRHRQAPPPKLPPPGANGDERRGGGVSAAMPPPEPAAPTA